MHQNEVPIQGSYSVLLDGLGDAKRQRRESFADSQTYP